MTDPAAISHQNHKLNFESFIKALEEKQNFDINELEASKPVELILAIYKYT